MLKATPRKDLYSPEIEALWLHVRFPATSVLFAVMYRPPDDNNFFNVVNTILEKAWLKSSNIFLLGDQNCDYNDCGQAPAVVTNRAKLQCILDNVNMYNVINDPTRNTMEPIDLIVTTRTDLVSATGVFPLGISEYDLIYATLRLKNKRPPHDSVGIPQDSDLGPTLLALYANDSPSSVPSGENYMFAD